MPLNTKVLGIALAMTAYATGTLAAEPTYKAKLTRTAYGAPHVIAANYGGLG